MAQKTALPKTSTAFEKLNLLMKKQNEKGNVITSKDGSILVKNELISEVSSKAKELGFSLKLVGFEKDFAKIQIRGLIKIDSIGSFTSGGRDFFGGSQECEMD
jgi:hypothetical protein